MLKKLFLTTLPLFISFYSFSQGGINWEDTITVNPGFSGNERPRVAVINNNIPVICWGEESSGSIYFSMANSTGGFSTPKKLNPAGTSAYVRVWTGPEMATISDTIFIVFKLTPEATGGVFMVKSYDGGITFSDTMRVSPTNGNIPWLPTVAVKKGGHPVVGYMDNNADWSNPHFLVFNSTDGGRTFNPPVHSSEGIAPGEVCDCCPSTVIVKDDFQAMLFRNNLSNVRTIWATISINNGLNFTSGKEVDKTGSVSTQCQATGPSGILQGDSLIVAWRSTAGGKTRVYLSSTHSGTLETGTHFRISDMPNSSIQNYPKVKGNNHVKGIVWQESLSGNADIIFTWSSDNDISSFSSNRDTINLNKVGNQWNPDIAYKDTIFHVVWQDENTGKVIYRKGSFGSSTLLKNQKFSKGIFIYPNPSSDYTSVSFDSKVDGLIEVYDISGKKILEKEVTNGKAIISLEETGPGFFILRAEHKGRVENIKFLMNN